LYKNLLCPSYRCEKDASLIGVIGPEGKVNFLNAKLEVSEEFISIASKGRTPEKRFRFSGKCTEHSCMHWKDDHCGLIDKLIENLANNIATPSKIPACPIRSDCRWYRQHNAKACSVCPYIITDLFVEE
jgi:hypothetical protein